MQLAFDSTKDATIISRNITNLAMESFTWLVMLLAYPKQKLQTYNMFFESEDRDLITFFSDSATSVEARVLIEQFHLNTTAVQLAVSTTTPRTGGSAVTIF